MHIFLCMGKLFYVAFQRAPLKFHTKYLTKLIKHANPEVYHHSRNISGKLTKDLHERMFEMLVIIRPARIMLVMIKYSAHNTTAQLSWHMQNFNLIGRLEFKDEQQLLP